jgi:hypothetical protein
MGVMMFERLIDWKVVWDQEERDWANGNTPANFEDWAQGMSAYEADLVTHAERGSAQWVFAYILISHRHWNSHARDLGEAIAGLAVVRSNLVSLDEEYRNRTGTDGRYMPDFRKAFADIGYYAAEFGIRETIVVPPERAVSRACIIRYIDAVGAKLRHLAPHANEPLPPRLSTAKAADAATPTIHWRTNQRGGNVVSVTVSYPCLSSGVRTRHVVRGPTRALLMMALLEQPGRVVAWTDLLQSGVRSGVWLITNPKSLERAGRRIRDGLPPELRGFWEQDGHGARWSFEATARDDEPASSSPPAAA